MPSGPEDGSAPGRYRDDPAAKLLVGRPLSQQDVAAALGAGSQSAHLADDPRLRDAPPACRLLLLGASVSALAAVALGIWWIAVYGPPFSPSLHGADLAVAILCAVLPLVALMVASEAVRGRNWCGWATLPLTVAMAATGVGAVLIGDSSFEWAALAIYLVGVVIYGAGGIGLVTPGPPRTEPSAPSVTWSLEVPEPAGRAASVELTSRWLDALARVMSCAAIIALSVWWSLTVPVAARTGPAWTALMLLLTALPALVLIVACARRITSHEASGRSWVLVAWPLVSAFVAIMVTVPHFGSMLIGVAYICLVFIIANAPRPLPPGQSTPGEVPAWLIAGRTRRLVGDDSQQGAIAAHKADATETPAEEGRRLGAFAQDAPVAPEAPEPPASPL